MSTSLYLDQETMTLLDMIRKSDVNFNLSQFVKKHLQFEHTGISENECNLIESKIKEAELLIKQSEEMLKFWKQKQISYEEEKRIKAVQIEEKRKQEEKEYLEVKEEIDLIKKKNELLKKATNMINEKGKEFFRDGIKKGLWKDFLTCWLYYHPEDNHDI